MKIFDMHIHTMHKDKIEQNKLLEKMEQAGVYGGGLISPCPPEAINIYDKMEYAERRNNILEWTKNQDGRLFPILWVHPFEKDACDIVKDAKESGIRGFKMICDSYRVDSPESMKLLEAIDKVNLPVLFHSGILWAGKDTSKNNRPAYWECLLNFKNIKFSMGHCSWPWYDECIAVYGKILNSYLTEQSSEMFFDTTPGTPKIYRKDLLEKVFTIYDSQNNVIFGSDSIAHDYNPEWVKSWIETDTEILDALNVTTEQKEKYFRKNFERFMSSEKIDHKIPLMNKES